jgi:hypothetical protein
MLPALLIGLVLVTLLKDTLGSSRPLLVDFNSRIEPAAGVVVLTPIASCANALAVCSSVDRDMTASRRPKKVNFIKIAIF